MSVLSVVQEVCSVVGVNRPTSIFSGLNANRTMQEMLSLANEMAQRIAYNTRDWRDLTAVATFAGDGLADRFPLPADYKRMLLSSNVWRSTSALQPMRFVSNPDEWLQRRNRGYNNAWGEWALFGPWMYIQPVMGAAIIATFVYLQKNCVRLTSGGVGDVFMADTDAFVLDERLLKLGMIWQWKANKGSPYAEDMANYQEALERVAGSDKPAPIIVDRLPMSASVQVAYPFAITLGSDGRPI